MNIEQAYEFINSTSKEYWDLLDFIHVGIGTIPPIHYVHKANGTAGFAYFSGKVEFNINYFTTHNNIKELEEIIAHELCHILQYRIAPQAKQGHGPEFRKYMNSLGFSGRTYHSMNVQKAKAANKNIFEQLMEVEI